MAERPESSKGLHPAKVALIGLLYALVSSVIIFAVTFALVLAWTSRLPFNPDFGTNGVNWIVVGIAMFDMVAVSLLLLTVFCLILPLRYKKLTKQPPSRLDARLIVAVILLVELIFCTLFMWGSPLIAVMIANGPMLAVTGAATIFFVNKLNANLASH